MRKEVTTAHYLDKNGTENGFTKTKLRSILVVISYGHTIFADVNLLGQFDKNPGSVHKALSTRSGFGPAITVEVEGQTVQSSDNMIVECG